jgi:ABC-type sugar transport system ATPase subunit
MPSPIGHGWTSIWSRATVAVELVNFRCLLKSDNMRASRPHAEGYSQVDSNLALAAYDISKSFPGVQALDGVNLELRAGEVHGLIGENGAGKSTLISILSGDLRPDQGRIILGGHELRLENPAAARRRGIVTIFQELAIQPWLSVSANIVLGNEPTFGPGRQLLSSHRADEVAYRALARVGAEDIPLKALAGNLSTGQKQLLEIARALAVNPSVIILDEPTSSLPSRDVARLLGVIKQLRADGTAVLFVSHRLDEVREISDAVTVLREGKVTATLPIQQLDSDKMIELMTGRRIGSLFPERASSIGDVALKVVDLTKEGSFENVSFEVRSGEIVGFAGLIGAGRTEVMRAIYGADRFDSGHIEVNSKPVRIRNPRDALAAGIAYLPEDRKEEGLLLYLPVRENMVLSSLRKFVRRGVISRKKIRAATTPIAASLNLRGRMEAAVANLSGGNQQKVVIAKALICGARIFIFDEPTRGIDVGTKYEVYSLMQRLASAGAAIILVSSELPEVMNVSHRLVVMSSGRIFGRYNWAEYNEKQILSDAFAAFAA